MVKWPDNIEEARKIQERFSGRVRLTPLRRPLRTVAGVDASFRDRETIAAVVVFDYKGLWMIDKSCYVTETVFPYIPGYLSFREGPAIISAVKGLGYTPDILIFDGQGIAHPRRFGIASHMGVMLGRPSIGCAKSRLVGEYREPAYERGSWESLRYNGEDVGAVLRTRSGVKPLFVSPGHLITTEDAIRVILHCTGRYRLPEPIRMADRLAGELKHT